MRISQFLQSLPFWPRHHPSYFANGVVDGKAAAIASGVTLPSDAARVGEQALLAARALPGKVGPEDVRVYRLGWIEGYRDGSKPAAQATGM